jgi:HAD superfamily hydrolase (TIGR01490 family)
MAGVVFSDVEGTLVSGNNPRRYIEIGRDIGVFSRWEVVRAAAIALLGKPLPIKPKTYFRFLAFRVLLKGHTVEDMQRVVEAAQPEMLKHLKPASLARLRQHQAEGRELILVSGGLQETVTSLAKELNAHGEGTQLEVRDGVYTGRPGDKVCQGEEKARRVKQLAQARNINLAEAVGYGDTVSDVRFLSLVGKAGAIDPDAGLRAEAERRGWEIILNNSEVALQEVVLS